MTKRLFTPKQDKQLAAEYMTGATYVELAAKYGGDAGTAWRAVKRGGGIQRTSGETQRKFTPEQDEQLAEEYAAGASYGELAERHGTTPLAVRGAVHRAGGNTRDHGETIATGGVKRRNFSPEEDKKLASEYDAGSSYRRLAKKYGGTDISVRNAVIRGGGTPRPTRLPHEWSDAAKPEALDLYRKGWSVRSLAKRFGTRTETISVLLAEANEPLHPGGKAHPSFRTEQQCREVADAYAAGADLAPLARRFECSIPTIKTAIRRAGGTIRPPGRSKVWTPEVIAWAGEQYLAGRSQQSIAEELGTHQTAVSAQLHVSGVIPPTKYIGESHPSWKGGRVLNRNAYVCITPTEEDLKYCTPNGSNYVLEHRLVMGRALGRPLRATESVHHKDGNKANNDLSNLQLRQGAHGSGIVMTCNACGSHDVRAVPIGN